MSLPLRECGLKSIHFLSSLCFTCHSPCGSVDWNKKYSGISALEGNVTPLAGVWIEMWPFSRNALHTLVTPLAGVWIEIKLPYTQLFPTKLSLPLRECGLKFQNEKFRDLMSGSLPLRECGLKCSNWWLFGMWLLSLPLRECGLKFPEFYGDENLPGVTPLAGVWIEIAKQDISDPCPKSLPLRECGLKSGKGLPAIFHFCHSPCGSVDWNLKRIKSPSRYCKVTPLAGVWIEISIDLSAYNPASASLPLRECGLK